jgi:hypothetical protein
MGFLARLLGAVPKEERGGIRLTDAEPWRVSPIRDVERFLRALPALMPHGAIAYFEDTAEPHVRRYLQSVSVAAQARVAVGTIWPRPDCYHVPVTTEAMAALASFLDKNPAGYFCAHCHVYRDGLVLLEWHDAFINEPMYLSRTVSEEAVVRFAHTLGCSFSTGLA